MDSLTGRLQKGSELATQAGDAIVAIQESNTKVLNVVREINEAMAEQGSASQDIARRVELVAQASEQSNRSVTVSAEAAKDIHQLSMDMRRNVERFRT
jgi:methyl-accepting chemotaxis protein